MHMSPMELSSSLIAVLAKLSSSLVTRAMIFCENGVERQRASGFPNGNIAQLHLHTCRRPFSPITHLELAINLENDFDQHWAQPDSCPSVVLYRLVARVEV